MRHLCGKSVAHARHTNDTHALTHTSLLVVPDSTLIASSARHLLVTEKKSVPPIWFHKEKNHLNKKKKFPGTKFRGTFGPPPTEKTEKIGKIKGTLVRKVPGNLRSQEFVFFLGRFFCPLWFPPLKKCPHIAHCSFAALREPLARFP